MATKKILIPLPSLDFDPTEVAVPWRILHESGKEIIFATPDGKMGAADMRMLTGEGLGPWKKILRADDKALADYSRLVLDMRFKHPRTWASVSVDEFDAILLPGGHAKGMKEYLDSQILQKLIAQFFAQKKIIAAICHGVLLAARSKDATGISVLAGKKTTSLTSIMELSAWAMTALWLGNYYRTYKLTVEAEVKASLNSKADYLQGPLALLRDDDQHLKRGFCVQDGNYLSARWPGDAHRFAHELVAML